MANKMLIDASHPEETRVVVLRGNRVEEFDFESASKKQLRGNIYLAKVTRVEPSLQAAFVDYGGNRHGFLAFSEIHPDYYQIPVADRLALLEDEARSHAQDDDEDGRNNQRRSRRRRPDRDRAEKRRPHNDDRISEAAPLDPGQPETDDSATDQSWQPHDHSAEGHAYAQPFGEQPFAPDDRGDRFSEEPTSGFHDQPEHDQPGPAEPVNQTGNYEPTADVPEHAYAAPVATEFPGPDYAATFASHHDHPVAANDEAIADDRNEPAAIRSHHDKDHADHPGHHTIAVDEAGYAVVEAEEEVSENGDEAPSNVEVIESRAPSDDDESEGDDEEEEPVEQLGGDAMEEMPLRQHRGRRQYKIQEVIKRRQVLLIQVVKEERGNKGAALTTYLSLAGRYSVLMPNTARGGGISRKITDATDRKRLKDLVQDLEVPEGMGVILRTAGASRTKPEIKRDFEYLLRMWENVRELTLKSTAPSLVYEEGSLIKRAIRDLYTKDVDEVLVAGDEGHREAKDFMRMLMPSHARNVQPWREPQPIFAKSGVEAQLDAMFSNVVTLRSGGYIVINQTEALVAIDVNSGRSTREHNIEDTALRTNLEAADEVARQLRLRDLAGLIVVDFIDMEEHRNNRSVERRMKEALKNDRARIQIGRISHFGLLEMSRQRIRTGVLEGSTTMCPHCAGAGTVRSTASIALHVLRVLEDALIRSAAHNITLRTRTEVALYILNQKRAHLHDVETRFGVVVIVVADDTLTGTTYHAIERGDLASPPPTFKRPELVRLDSVPIADLEEETEEFETDEDVESEEVETTPGSAEEDSAETRRRRRRRRRRGRNGEREESFVDPNAPQPSDMGLAVMAEIAGDIPHTMAEAPVSDGETDDSEAESFEIGGEGEEEQGGDSRRRRRSRRGGRNRRRGERDAPNGTPSPFGEAAADDYAPQDSGIVAPLPGHEPEFARPVVHYAAPDDVQPIVHHEAPAAVTAPVTQEPAPVASPVMMTVEPEAPKAPEPPPAYTQPLPEVQADPSQPKRTGWWARAEQTFGGT